MAVRSDDGAESLAWPIDAHVSRPQRRVLRFAMIAAVLLCTGAVVAKQTFASTDPVRYRTASASTHDVQEVLAEVGTVASVKQASVSFPVSGTVESVDVEVGDVVEPGDVLASLDPEDLKRGVTTAKSALAQAELTLERALNGEDPRGRPGGVPQETAPAATPAPTSAPASGGASSRTTSSSSTDDDIRQGQQRVLDAQRAVDEALLDAQESLASATAICDSVGSSSPDPSAQAGSADASAQRTAEPSAEPKTALSSPEPTTTPSPSESPDSTDSSDDVAACRDALQEVLDAQRYADVQQDALVSASEGFDELLSRKATELEQMQATADDQSPSSTSIASDEDTTYEPTSEELTSYQKAIDAAEVDVAVANQALRQATIHAPVSGTVKDIDIDEGDDVTAGDDASSILIVGDGGYEITAIVGVTDLPDVEVGQEATVTPDDGSPTLTGELTMIGLSSDSSSGSSYPVTISIDGDTGKLRNGSTVSVSIVTGGAADVLAVPTSAVEVDNGRASVTVLDGDATRRVNVDVGAIGATWTEITSGLDDGQEVVLADLTEALPGSATEGESGAGGGQNRFPGGGSPRIFQRGG